MNPDPRADPSLNLETIRQVDEICTIFEEKWRCGDRPLIEELLAGRDGLERSAALRELLAVEIELRLRTGERPSPDEYAQRFPGHRDLVDFTFREAGEVAKFYQRQCEANTSPAHLPRAFGDYQLLEEIARGGMGVVYKACQVSLDRIVAIKMILAGQLASNAEVERFYLEAQAAAQLEHPNIVPIIEVGKLNGQRYFTMGFVDGVSLANRLAAGSMPPQEAARLLLAVAEAVQYAHQQGIIHRDLKPANILLDTSGRPRITDFGLAKRVSDKSGLTGTGQIIGTPSFMSPEQATGKTNSISVASDVYSLGAVLYTALTGRPPFQAASTLDTLKQVLEQEPVAPRRLDPTVPRDLETITLKCLQKNPARRYATAQLVADEFRRFLAGQAILARPIGRLERTHRWCRRYPVVTALLGLVALLLTAVTVTSTVAALRIAALRDEAVEQEQNASENLVRAESERARAEQNLQYAQKTSRQLAESYSLLGDQHQQITARLEWYEKAHKLLASLTRDSPASLELQIDLAGSFGRLGLLQARAGENMHAMRAFDQAIEMLERLCRERPDLPHLKSDLAQACDYLGRQYAADNQHDAALKQHQQACRFQEQLIASAPPGTIESRRDLALYYADLGALHFDLNHLTESQASYDQALRGLEPLVTEHPSDVELQTAWGIVCRDIGIRRPPVEAAPWLHRARAILEAIVAVHPQEIRCRFELAKLFTAIAKHENRPESALAWQRQAHDLWDQLAGQFPLDPDIQRNAVWTLLDDANFLRFTGYISESTAALQNALDQVGTVAGAGSVENQVNFEIFVLAMLARNELGTGDSVAYRRHCRAIVEHCRVRNCYQNDLLRVCMLLDDAVDDRQQLVDLTNDAITQGSRTLRKRANVGAALYRAGQYEKAIQTLSVVYESNRMALLAGLGTAEVVRADNARSALFLAMAHFRLGRSDLANTWLAKAREWIEGEGKQFAAVPASNADHVNHLGADNEDAPSGVADAMVAESDKTVTDLGKAPSQRLGIEDRMLLADIVFELQVLLVEAEALETTDTR